MYELVFISFTQYKYAELYCVSISFVVSSSRHIKIKPDDSMGFAESIAIIG